MKGFGFRFALVFIAVFAVLFLFVFFYLSVTSQVQAAELLPVQSVEITSQDGKTHVFQAELAETPSQQAQGLMHRKAMAADAGMIFPYDPPQAVAFWMKNTYLALDMLFIDAEGRIFHIVEGAEPLSTKPIVSNGKVSYVLELNAGQAKAHGIQVGDLVRVRDTSAAQLPDLKEMCEPKRLLGK